MIIMSSEILLLKKENIYSMIKAVSIVWTMEQTFFILEHLQATDISPPVYYTYENK